MITRVLRQSGSQGSKPRPTGQLLIARLLISATLFMALNGTAHAIAPFIEPDHSDKREDFIKAEKALKQGQMKTYRALYNQLDDYPLKPYLEYKDITRSLYTLPYERVDAFLNSYPNTVLGVKLRTRWLKLLAQKKRWHEYQSYYSTSVSNTGLACQYLYARLQNGETEAYSEVPALWNVGESQPKDCNPLFKRWLKAGHLTPQLVWERHEKAIQEREFYLAKYLRGLMKGSDKEFADFYQSVYHSPYKVAKPPKTVDELQRLHDIIPYGIKRLARVNPTYSAKLWRDYQAQYLFDSLAIADTSGYIALRLARKGHMQQAIDMSPGAYDDAGVELMERLIRDSLKQLNWAEAYQWLNRLPTDQQHTNRWLYWRARAMQELNVTDVNFPSIDGIYETVAVERDFYGFLSADYLGREYTMGHEPANADPAAFYAMATKPGLQRAKELLALKRINSARREWIYTTRDFSNADIKVAGSVAKEWGWYRKGIQAMAAAKYWDDIQVRFPLAFSEHVSRASKDTNIEPTLLFAIARQESAFTPDARSPVGALGLMQLMPATAKQTARREGVHYSHQYDLLQPEKNITLGSRYLNQLLKKFKGNRILAAAAYNAGPYRVQSWLKNTNAQLPYDVWIETIPFRETRGYVQNILAYSVIYGYRLGDSTTPMINSIEAKQRL